jgi:hypothetical protein
VDPSLLRSTGGQRRLNGRSPTASALHLAGCQRRTRLCRTARPWRLPIEAMIDPDSAGMVAVQEGA